ncbi:UDP-N-acetylmuramoyl-tripeptide--D-alanyl-D-alanine ligase [Herbaspirillum sp. RTI4]|uniref:UDP-N-acetylmuramoyl-tripeptide--D-alanyl-D- alanine ligase n=1 Tax=Herbaspirillum sp. RTI4 TaxID=3048640 RepID=UPI002AB4AF69|nr:UDP-N-acetylmuramoyl-tripeptide--D-alanyl-D-alanine ligase [Herbaspirillum sp. RTI4]MDY7577474.1 UDP-N-acetylmuramoyl-tripeptide--D-alanyl-D-alanine ligase [Herbaspirillum sp. RTI4]MEA9981750.1 UDP-N-acetylmuramoyl-tripeptide--D-alanyl-D-alanine ligase [Herbaspirillum sp. RTI4]
MRATFAQLLQALPQAQWQPHDAAADQVSAIDGVTTDSRAVKPGMLFVALRGERFDAHDFLAAVQEQGAAAVVVERLVPGLSIPALVVPDARLALGQLAHYWRGQFALPLIGVTGSNGKTTVKEMLASILAAAYGEDYLATRGNFNNDIGVPLTLFRLQAGQRAAVIELGMNHPGEIAVLSRMAQPSVALVNNAQREHLEFMSSVAAVADENGAVLSSLQADGVAVFPADDEFTARWRELAGARRTLTFGLTAAADVSATYQTTGFGSALVVAIRSQLSGQATANFALQLAAAGEHNVRNALAAIACAFGAGIGIESIVAGLEAFAPVNGRLQRKHAACGALVIDDTYNANPDSVRAAIDVLAHSGEHSILVLGDMGEVGDEGPQFHAEIGAYAQQRGISRLLGLGALMSHAVAAFNTAGENKFPAQHFATIEALNAALAIVVESDTPVLVKGSRFMQMERVVQQLAGAASGTTAQNKQGNH